MARGVAVMTLIAARTTKRATVKSKKEWKIAQDDDGKQNKRTLAFPWPCSSFCSNGAGKGKKDKVKAWRRFNERKEKETIYTHSFTYVDIETTQTLRGLSLGKEEEDKRK